jgi:hypothetical protein
MINDLVLIGLGVVVIAICIKVLLFVHSREFDIWLTKLLIQWFKRY